MENADLWLTRLRALAFVAFLGAIAAVSFAALQPALAPPVAGHVDKVLHFAAFAGLALLGQLAAPGRYSAAFVLLALLAVAAGTEWAQGMVPGRQSSLLDLAADLVGIFAGHAGGWILTRAWRGRNPLTRSPLGGFRCNSQRICSEASDRSPVQ